MCPDNGHVSVSAPAISLGEHSQHERGDLQRAPTHKMTVPRSRFLPPLPSSAGLDCFVSCSACSDGFSVDVHHCLTPPPACNRPLAARFALAEVHSSDGLQQFVRTLSSRNRTQSVGSHMVRPSDEAADQAVRMVSHRYEP